MMMVELRKASERHGPVTHYLIVVVPEKISMSKNTRDFKMDEVSFLLYVPLILETYICFVKIVV